MRVSWVGSAIAVGALATVGLVACQPPPPRAQLWVTSVGTGADGNPGDGICAAPDANDECTLDAAIEEANALGPTDVHLRPYRGSLNGGPVTVTGDLAIVGNNVRDTTIEGYDIEVASGAHLRVADLDGGTSSHEGPTFTVAGSLHLERFRSVTVGGPVLTVLPGGGVVAQDSFLSSGLGGATIDSQGSVVLFRSTLHTVFANPLVNSGVSAWLATASVGYPGASESCVGTPPVSAGYNRTGFPGCGLAEATDSRGLTLAEFGSPTNSYFIPEPNSPLVDAIPLGVAGCSTDAVDLFGDPRGGDGNGDGIPGCDIGAVELSPSRP